jgi:hypothetical protein
VHSVHEDSSLKDLSVDIHKQEDNQQKAASQEKANLQI